MGVVNENLLTCSVVIVDGSGTITSASFSSGIQDPTNSQNSSVLYVVNDNPKPFLLNATTLDGTAYGYKNGEYLGVSTVGSGVGATMLLTFSEPVDKFVLSFDKSVGYPTSVKINGQTISNDDYSISYTTAIATANFTVQIVSMSDNVSPLMVVGIANRIAVDLDKYRGLESATLKHQYSGNDDLLNYGVISQQGNISFVDYNDEIDRLANDGLLKGGMDATITLGAETKSIVGKYQTKLWRDDGLRSFGIQLGDALTDWQKITIIQQPLKNNISARYIYNLLVSNSGNFTFDVRQKTLDVFDDIIIENFYLESDNLWNQWNKFCELTQSYIYIQYDGTVRIKAFREIVEELGMQTKAEYLSTTALRIPTNAIDFGNLRIDRLSSGESYNCVAFDNIVNDDAGKIEIYRSSPIYINYDDAEETFYMTNTAEELVVAESVTASSLLTTPCPVSGNIDLSKLPNRIFCDIQNLGDLELKISLSGTKTTYTYDGNFFQGNFIANESSSWTYFRNAPSDYRPVSIELNNEILSFSDNVDIGVVTTNDLIYHISGASATNRIASSFYYSIYAKKGVSLSPKEPNTIVVPSLNNSPLYLPYNELIQMEHTSYASKNIARNISVDIGAELRTGEEYSYVEMTTSEQLNVGDKIYYDYEEGTIDTVEDGFYELKVPTNGKFMAEEGNTITVGLLNTDPQQYEPLYETFAKNIYGEISKGNRQKLKLQIALTDLYKGDTEHRTLQYELAKGQLIKLFDVFVVEDNRVGKNRLWQVTSTELDNSGAKFMNIEAKELLAGDFLTE